MEAAKVLLEYLRVLIWPVVVISFLIGFSPEVRDLMKRVSKIGAAAVVSLEFSTGQAEREAVPEAVPDVWFDIQETSLRQNDCMSRAQSALASAGFQHIEAGPVTYGYTDLFVGAVWCGWREGLVMITVAGPKKQGLQTLYSQLAKAFSSASP